MTRLYKESRKREATFLALRRPDALALWFGLVCVTFWTVVAVTALQLAVRAVLFLLGYRDTTLSSTEVARVCVHTCSDCPRQYR